MSDSPEKEVPDNEHVILAKGLHQEEALVLVSALEADGIAAYVKTETLGGHIPGGVSSIVFVPKNDLEQARRIHSSSEGEPAPKAHVNKWRNLMVGIFMFGAWSVTLIMAGAIGYQAATRTHLKEEVEQALPMEGAFDEEAPVDKKAALGPVRKDSRGREYVALDQNGDGFFETSQYDDAEGRATELRVDQNKDGKVDLVREYDEDGLISHEREDVNGDGNFDRWTEFTGGVGVREFHDLDFDGSRDMETELDDKGFTKKSVTMSKGKVISEAWFKNSIGQRELVDLDRDGKLDTELLYDAMGVVRKVNKLSN